MNTIWNKHIPRKDSYHRFRRSFVWDGKKDVAVRIAADSTFVLYVNGKRCPVSQTADFPEDRTYSEYNITSLLFPGKNILAVEVHYIGENFLTYRTGQAFLYCSISGEKADASGWKTAPAVPWKNGLCQKVSGQLGYTFCYDARLEDNWLCQDYDDSAWDDAVSASYNWTFSLRKVPQLTELPVPETELVQHGTLFRRKELATPAATCNADFLRNELFHENCFSKYDESQKIDGIIRTRIKLRPGFVFRKLNPDEIGNGYYAILDLKQETVGYPCIDLTAPAGTVVDIVHGEHLGSGRCRADIFGRNFTDRYICRDGQNTFCYTHRRLGLRYLELHIIPPQKDSEIILNQASVIPLELPLPEQAELDTEDRLLKRIMDVSIRTLLLCMHEHYEDCPWREQGLYAYDSRNQILYGYYVWGNYDFAEASLDLLGKSFDGDRYLALTSPGLTTLTIPVFTLVWITELCEFMMYSGRTGLFEKWRNLADLILDRALDSEDPEVPGLYHPGEKGNYIWNFCEWNGQLSSLTGNAQAPFNLYLHEALLSAAKMHRYTGNPDRAEYLTDTAEKLGKTIEKTFYDPEWKCYRASLAEDPERYEHIQAVMLAENLVPEEKTPEILELFRRKKLRGIDLSALRYFVRAMAENGADARQYLQQELREILEPVILSGATSLWETRRGSEDFISAGSLCHGWSSVMPYFCGAVMLGVMPLEPGFRKFSLRPYCGDMTRLDGEIPTPHGMIRVQWSKAPDQVLEVSVTHPAETEMVPLPPYSECPFRIVQIRQESK